MVPDIEELRYSVRRPKLHKDLREFATSEMAGRSAMAMADETGEAFWVWDRQSGRVVMVACGDQGP